MHLMTAMLPCTLPDGNPAMGVLAKGTFVLSMGAAAPAPRELQIPLAGADAFDDPADPAHADPIAESDFVPPKPSTDIIVLGKVKAPLDKKAYFIDAGIEAGAAGKMIRVFGARTVESRLLKGMSFSDPEPFDEAPLGYRYAYGGCARDKNGIPHAFPPNPIGRGFNLKESIRDFSAIDVPRIEDPERPLSPDDLLISKFHDWTKAPLPVSLGWTRRDFYPRFTYAGMRMDRRFYQGGSAELSEKILRGNELVRLIHLDAKDPRFEFNLPDRPPRIAIALDGTNHTPLPMLQTVVIDMEKKLMSMTWLAWVSYEKSRPLADLIPRFSYSVEADG